MPVPNPAHPFVKDGHDLTYFHAVGTTDITTSSLNWSDMAEMSITIEKAGYYLLLFSACITAFSAAPIIQLGLHVKIRNVTQASDILETRVYMGLQPDCLYMRNLIVPVQCAKVENLAVNDNIKVQWHSLLEGLTIYNRPSTIVNEFRNFTALKLK